MVDRPLEDTVSVQVTVEDSDYNSVLNSEDSLSVSSDQDEDNYSSTPDSEAIAITAVRNEVAPVYGNVTVSGSDDVHLGNKTIYNGSVTIKQYYPSSNFRQVSEEDAFSSDSYLSYNNHDSVILGICNTTNHETSPSNNEVLPQHLPRPTNGEILSSNQVEITDKWNLLTSCLRRRYIVCTVMIGVAVVLLIATLLVFPSMTQKSHDTKQPLRDPPTPPNMNLRFSIVPREHWLAESHTGIKLPLQQPVPYVIISHTTTEHCTTRIRCISIVRAAQEFHMGGNGWHDIGYNFLVGGDGNVYEGRGWDTVASHAYGYNSCSIGIAFIGRFADTHPPQQQMDAAELLIAEGVRLGKIRPDYRLLGHRHVSATKSPGDALYEDMKKMPHFSESVALPCGAVIKDMDSKLLKQTRR